MRSHIACVSNHRKIKTQSQPQGVLAVGDRIFELSDVMDSDAVMVTGIQKIMHSDVHVKR